jgi:hypothetical protein
VGRLSIALAITAVCVACNPKSLKPGYCHTSSDCGSGVCDNRDGGTFMCGPTDGSVDTDGSIDGGDTGPPKCMSNSDCVDMGTRNVCNMDTGKCEECLSDDHCMDATKPICNLPMMVCERCTMDSQCVAKVPSPGVCMFHQDGRCATDSETIYVESKTGCLSAPTPTGGTSATPFCKLQDALSALGDRRLFVVRGSGDVGNTSIQNLPGGQISIVGPGTRITAAVGSPGFRVAGNDVFVRGLKILGDAGTDIGIVADSGATIRLDSVTVENMSKGGLRVIAAGYEIVNCLLDGNGGAIDDGGRFIGGAFLGAASGSQLARFAFNTVVSNNDKGVICESTSQTIQASLLANNLGGGATPDVSSCTLSLSKTTMDGAPNLTTTDPKFRLTTNSPCRNAISAAPANAPDHDIDGTKRPQEGFLDCGADEF